MLRDAEAGLAGGLFNTSSLAEMRGMPHRKVVPKSAFEIGKLLLLILLPTMQVMIRMIGVVQIRQP
jgi:hypothetical protein